MNNQQLEVLPFTTARKDVLVIFGENICLLSISQSKIDRLVEQVIFNCSLVTET